MSCGQPPSSPAALELSVVIPAFNEEKLLDRTLTHLRRALAALELDTGLSEVVVCDNASTDATAAIAGRYDARVVHESHRQIARARNVGAAAARGWATVSALARSGATRVRSVFCPDRADLPPLDMALRRASAAALLLF